MSDTDTDWQDMASIWRRRAERAESRLALRDNCDREPLCAAALATNLQLRARVAELQRELEREVDVRPVQYLFRVGETEMNAARRARDEALAEADAARLHVWQRLPWRGYAS